MAEEMPAPYRISFQSNHSVQFSPEMHVMMDMFQKQQQEMMDLKRQNQKLATVIKNAQLRDSDRCGSVAH